MRSARLVAGVFLVSACVATARAEQSGPPSSSTDAAALCAHISLAAEGAAAKVQPLFPEMREAALEVRRTLCIREGTPEQILDAFAAFVAKAIESKWFSAYGGFRNGEEPMLQVKEALARPDQIRQIPTMAPAGQPNEVVIQGRVYAAASASMCDQKAGDVGCDGALDEFMKYYNYAHTTFASEGARAFARAVSGLSREWDAYLANARSLTPLELLINSALFKRSEQQQFSPPPRLQWIVLHPSLVVENVSDAVGGEKLKGALMVEFAGVNWWRQNKWYVPTGGSIVTVYADRPGMEGWGYGAVLHFRSVYSAGYTKRGSDDDGVFVSFDLLKLLQDKKQIIDGFKP